MTLWTIQEPDAVAALERDGRLVANAGEPCDGFDAAYRWMAAQMVRALGPAPVGARPLWAWHTWRPGSPRPDLRASGHLPRGTRAARIAFEVSPAHVLLSDFDRWHCVLNDTYLAVSDADEEAFEAVAAAAGDLGRGPWPASIRPTIEASWQRVFELTPAADDPRVPVVQATLWTIPAGAVRELTWFTAR